MISIVFGFIIQSHICNQMQQFKFRESDGDLSCLQHYSSEQLSLLNSRKRHNGDISQRQSEVERQNQEEIKEFKREIEERFKLSICNKIYTFPRIIKSFYDIVSSEEQEESTSSQHRKPTTVQKREGQFKKKDKIQSHHKAKVNDTCIRLYQNEPKMFESAKLGKDKLKTNESTGKRKEEELKQKSKNLKSEKTTSGKKQKKKVERLKTEQQSSGSFLQTLRSKMGKKN